MTRNGWCVGTLVLLVAVLAAACGQGESGSENGERSANASESASEGDFRRGRYVSRSRGLL